jgi:Sulfotransferase domain
VVRNPLDVILSWTNLVCLNNHNTKAPFNFSEEYPNWWQQNVEKIVNEMKRWYGTLIYHARKRDVPTIFVRFEDLCMNPKPELDLLMRFFTGLPNLKGTNAEHRVSEVMALGDEATKTYDLKDSSKKFNSTMKNYNEK